MTEITGVFQFSYIVDEIEINNNNGMTRYEWMDNMSTNSFNSMSKIKTTTVASFCSRVSSIDKEPVLTWYRNQLIS